MFKFASDRDNFRKKNFGKTGIVIALSVLTVLSGLFLPLTPAVLAGDLLVPACTNVTGQGQDVLVNNVANSGKMQFGIPQPADQYKACARVVDGQGNLRLEGWVSDTNLGWISFYCSSGKNMTVICGDKDYGVTVDKATGELHGYAWGDASGWISFNCADVSDGNGGNICGTASNYKVKAELPIPGCLGGDIYSNQAPAGCPAHTQKDAFAWSDRVGWFDLSGVNIPLNGVEKKPAAPEVKVSVDKDPSTLTKADAPLANGQDAYTLKVEITSGNEFISDGPKYSVKIMPVWQDTVKLDQRKTDNNADDHSADNDGAVTKPLGIDANGGLSFVDGVGYTSSIKSVAPTSNMNVYVGTDANGKDKTYSNEQFSVNKNLKPAANNLHLQMVQAQVFDVVNNKCLIPAPVKAGPCGNAFGYYYPNINPNGLDFKFSPPVEVSTFVSDYKDPNVLNGTFLVSNQVDIGTTCKIGNCGSIQFDFGMKAPFALVSTASLQDDPLQKGSQAPFSVSVGQPATYYLTPTCPNLNCPIATENPYAYSTVSYNLFNKDVKYYSAKLPRGAGQVLNPVAFVKGNVYSTGVTNVQQGVDVKSLGDVSTNVLRDTVFMNVSNIIAGIKLSDFNSISNIQLGTTGFIVSNPSYGKLLLKDNTTQQAKVYYYNGDINIKNSSWLGEKTVISIGGNVYIDGNLYNTVQPGTKPKLGIIVLKNLVTGKGGNVYIAPTVKNIQANIFADGSVFSYDGDPSHINFNSGTNYGLPCFADEDARQGFLINQLSFEGSIASLNTIGGSASAPPILGNGLNVNGAAGEYGGTSNCQPTDRSKAKLYDLNYLRFYGLAYEVDADTNEIKDQNGDGQITPVLSPGGDLVLIPGGGQGALGLDPNSPSANYGVVIGFDPPTATLPGFGVQTTLNLQQKQR